MLECNKIKIQNKKTKFYLFENFNIKIKNNEIYTLTGPSGFGKSTLLKYICGIEENNFLYSGKNYLNQKLLNDIPTNKRKIGMIFQNDLLFPHMNVLENLLFATPLAKKRNKEEALNILEELKLSHLALNQIKNLSGGEYSRICLARMIINQPKALLLDEPFNNLDKDNKKNTRDFFFKTIIEMNCPVLIVSHNSDDIFSRDKLIKL